VWNCARGGRRSSRRRWRRRWDRRDGRSGGTDELADGIAELGRAGNKEGGLRGVPGTEAGVASLPGHAGELRLNPCAVGALEEGHA